VNKTKYLKEIQNRLPENLIIKDETSYEFIGILAWIKYLNIHYNKRQKNNNPDMLFPLISKRLHLDFGFYNTKDENGKYIIYISPNGQMLNGRIKEESIKGLINTWGL
jgi:hypothetical protein